MLVHRWLWNILATRPRLILFLLAALIAGSGLALFATLRGAALPMQQGDLPVYNWRVCEDLGLGNVPGIGVRQRFRLCHNRGWEVISYCLDVNDPPPPVGRVCTRTNSDTFWCGDQYQRLRIIQQDVTPTPGAQETETPFPTSTQTPTTSATATGVSTSTFTPAATSTSTPIGTDTPQASLTPSVTSTSGTPPSQQQTVTPQATITQPPEDTPGPSRTPRPSPGGDGNLTSTGWRILLGVILLGSGAMLAYFSLNARQNPLHAREQE